MELITKCDKTFSELYKFSEDILVLGESISDNRLEDFEKKIDHKLPEEFKYILKKHNRIVLNGTEIYGISKKFLERSLDKIYTFEHSDVGNPMPKNFLPFSPDGRGNHYCLDLSKIKEDICPIVFWQWDFEYDSIEDVEVCNESFTEWIDEVMIEWNQNDIDSDGTEK
jgi:SMI1 / KNR4 family.